MSTDSDRSRDHESAAYRKHMVANAPFQSYWQLSLSLSPKRCETDPVCGPECAFAARGRGWRRRGGSRRHATPSRLGHRVRGALSRLCSSRLVSSHLAQLPARVDSRRLASSVQRLAPLPHRGQIAASASRLCLASYRSSTPIDWRIRILLTPFYLPSFLLSLPSFLASALTSKPITSTSDRFASPSLSLSLAPGPPVRRSTTGLCRSLSDYTFLTLFSFSHLHLYLNFTRDMSTMLSFSSDSSAQRGNLFRRWLEFFIFAIKIWA